MFDFLQFDKEQQDGSSKNHILGQKRFLLAYGMSD